MNKIFKLTNNSWIIRAGIDNSGLLFKNSEGYLFLSISKRIEFKTIEEVYTRFGHLKEEIRENKDTQLSIIDGFPVRHENITIISEKPPLYNKGTDIIFAAGYWCIKYPNGWTLTLCPKQKTTQEYDTSGPYRNRLESMNRLNSLKNIRNIEAHNDII
jgi:hypothetical protein